MKRFHVHVSVEDIDQSVRFYSTLFGSAPAKLEPDYAKWMLEDPRINFAISRRGAKAGIDHIGFQVDSSEELAGLKERLQAADASMIDETGTSCCYARSDKHWVTDPAGIAWESFHTLADIPTFNGRQVEESPRLRKPLGVAISSDTANACCAPGSSASCSPSSVAGNS
jgi:catechol 2,3-dioxygenase-like lactoylglutathione lyase family enzyme